MGSFNFIPLPNAIPTAAKTASGAKLETNGSLASKPNGKSFQTILTQAGEKLQTQKSENTIKFKDLPEELQKLIKEKFGITKNDDIQLIKLPANAVRVDENGELRVSIEEIESLLKEQSSTSTFHFLDIKNNENEETGEEPEIQSEPLQSLDLLGIKSSNSTTEESNQDVTIINDKTFDTKTFETNTFDIKTVDTKTIDTETVDIETVDIETDDTDLKKLLHQAEQSVDRKENEEVVVVFDKINSVLNSDNKNNSENIDQKNISKNGVIQLKPELQDKFSFDKETQQSTNLNKVTNSIETTNLSEIIVQDVETNSDGMVYPERLEITDELASEIAKLEKNKSNEKSEYLVIKSPVQSNGDNDKPVLFLINAKDIQTESNVSQKLSVLKNEAVQSEKIQTIDGQIKVNISGSDQYGNENSNDSKSDNKNDNASKNNHSAKLPLLTESAFQLSKSLNEHAEANQSSEKTATFRAEVKSGLDQTALEMKTIAKPLQSNTVADNAGSTNSGSSSTSATSTNTVVSQTLDQISSTSTQQSTGTQSTAKPGAPAEIPQAYQNAAAQQIVKGVQSSLGSERSHISIHLQPESLGKVDIQLKMENGMLTAHIVAEKDSTQAMLEKNATVLKSALEEKNILIDKLHISKDASEYRQSQQEQNRSNERWREYQQQQHEDQNRSRREHNNQQQDLQDLQDLQDQKKPKNNPWQSITNYMDRFFQRSQA